MVRQRVSVLSTRNRLGIAVSAALLLAMAFVGSVFAHSTVPTVSIACDGTVSWHVADWAAENAFEGTAPDVEAWYSLDGGAYVKIGDFAFTASNYTTGFGGTFDGGSATSVTIKADIAPGTAWGDGDSDPADLGPWFSTTAGKVDCDAPSSAPSTAPSPTGSVLAATGRPHPTVPATSTDNQTPTSGSSSSIGFLLILFAVVALVIGFAPISRRRQPSRAETRRRR